MVGLFVVGALGREELERRVVVDIMLATEVVVERVAAVDNRHAHHFRVPCSRRFRYLKDQWFVAFTCATPLFHLLLFRSISSLFIVFLVLQDQFLRIFNDKLNIFTFILLMNTFIFIFLLNLQS